MIQPGMMFGGEGPVMNGTWYNPHTGDAFTVRDSFFEDNQYVVTTTDGRYFRYEQLQNYIQSDMKLEDLKRLKNDIQNKPVKETLPPEVSNLIDSSEDNFSDLMIPDDEIYTNPNMKNTPSLGNINKPASNNSSKTIAPSAVNTTIIEKALKNASKPDFSININWPDYPDKQIEMLKDIMDIPVDEIINWYLDNIQFNDFIIAFKNAIDERIKYSTGTPVEVKALKLPEPEEVITIEAPTADESHDNDNDGGALAKEPKKLGGPKTPRGGRKPVNKKKE